MSRVAETVTFDEDAFTELEGSFRGQLIRSGDAGYEDARRIWKGSINRFPALVPRCDGVADVVAAVRFARRTGMIVAVRGGGHSFPGLSSCDGGVVIDLSSMKGIHVDPETRIAAQQ